MNILYVVVDGPEEWNSAEWRCAIPARAISKLPEHEARLIEIDDWTNSNIGREASDWADVIVVQRLLFGRALSFAFEQKLSAGKIVILDVDDAYHLVESGTPAYNFWREGNGKLKTGEEVKYNTLPWKSLFAAGKIASAVSTPSEKLLEYWRPYVDTSVYIPNYLDLGLYNPEPNNNRRPIVGWGGSAQHLRGLEDTQTIKAISRLVKTRKDVMVMVVWNFNFFTELAKEIGSTNNLIFQSKVPFDQWPKIMNRFDVGLAPLSGPYDACKSEIKVLEYMAMFVPWVASSGYVYDGLSHFGITVKNTAREWLDAIIYQLDSPDKSKMSFGYEYAKTRGIEANINKIIDIYKEIKEDR
jgi:glycosyltransferase involved in cell wall biosynthesis